ncbi:diaminobutyrate acetyltransferase [Anaerobacillus isosaccharinicus]|uniref:L-2,4-diaminobutyric acid acetyltransferase n=1 Tax=Anaerobacillus isosaccharinicus TaxID=1532552 RepID=A0A1S2M8N6_9BACI|nr:diaminobutyrate acetyltransferase [Anaerobacillus isosaccharinicus]QOY36732.1 diaminobutyrate acetyltransferase [Anaerobacillus isosaccharinicus]
MKSKHTMDDTLCIEKPNATDGSLMWQLVKQSTLDLNSPYKYIMMCEYFSETCVVVKKNEQLLGFITAFIPPKKQDVIFVWQVGVDPSQHGKGIASKMLAELLKRDACKNVRYLEATVTPSNQASQSLFRGFARKKQTECVVKPCFSADLFPGENHEEELTFRVGPFI